ncbi:hypothetical protein HYT57_04990 [Candidatus Woesearchaeota archaeon]|nr:hypothetical protein [Candidatus Woesearchaeota archaeon]
MSLGLLLATNILIIILIFLLLYFKWIVNTIRQICHSGNEGGYTKFIQTIIVLSLICVFFVILVYFIVYPSEVNEIDVILTVVVGWLGAIIGGFFGEKSMEQFNQKQSVKKAEKYMAKSEDIISKLIEKLKEK